MGFGGFGGSKTFLFQENGVGMMVWVIRDEFDGVQEFIRNLDRGEVFGVGEDEIFFAMMKASDMFEHEALEFMKGS